VASPVPPPLSVRSSLPIGRKGWGSAAKPRPNQIVRLAPPSSPCRGIGEVSQGSPCRSVAHPRGRVAAGSRQSATRSSRARPSGRALRQRSSAVPTAQPVAELFPQGAFSSPGGDVAGRAPSLTTTLPPTAAALRAGSRSPHNTHLLLTGPSRAGARTTPVSTLGARAAPAAEAQVVRRTPPFSHFTTALMVELPHARRPSRRAVVGALVSSVSGRPAGDRGRP
jgi:hypothetical protein